MMYGLAVRLCVSGPADGLMDHVDQVTEFLVELEDCTAELLDSTIGLDASTGMVEVEMTLEADLTEAAFAVGLSCLRTAIHKAGGRTPDWDEFVPDGENLIVYRLNADEAIEIRQLVAA